MKKLVVSLGLAAAACSSGAKDSVTLSSRVATASGQSLPAADAGVQAAIGIELTRVRVAVRRLRVEGRAAGTEVEISQGPLLVDASGTALSGALLQLVTKQIPPGTYDELKVDIHPVVSAPEVAFQDLVSRGASVLLEGKVDGQPFTFASAMEAELQHEGQFVLGGAATNITLNVDASKWFVAADGSRLDPTVAANKAAIEANIRSSISAFEDDDEDGVEDHHGRHDDGEHDGGGHDGGDHDGGVDGGHG
jgi:hypothetical protein